MLSFKLGTKFLIKLFEIILLVMKFEILSSSLDSEIIKNVFLIFLFII